VSAGRVVVVAALDRHRAIGRSGGLPWHLPDDLRRFQALTTGGTLLMGRRTAESIGRPLPRRRTLVLTRSGRAPHAGVQAVASLDEALRETPDGETLVVVGGAEVYALALPLASTLHLTHVDAEVDGADAWFPDWDRSHWRVRCEVAHPADDRHDVPFRFVDWVRRDMQAPG
jgi:dihydrofolate reductase